MMNTDVLEMFRSTVEVEVSRNVAEVELIPVETINYGFMGMQQYEGVDPVARDNN